MSHVRDFEGGIALAVGAFSRWVLMAEIRLTTWDGAETL